jgi:hypothetical protein
VLTLDALQRNTDAIVVLRNDDGFFPAAHGPVKPQRSFGDVNGVFSSLLLPLLYFGSSARAVGELIAKCAPDRRFKMLSLVPLPQRNFARYNGCALLSREYKLSGMRGNGHVPTAPGAPLDQIHNHVSRRMLECATSCAVVSIPKGFAAACSAPLLDVLVLNQVEEMTRSFLFPLLRDCKYKLQSRAFLHQLEATGVTAAFIEAAFRRVVTTLCYDDVKEEEKER